MTLASCSSLRITSDYDAEVDFSKYRTFAFSKKEIDKADASDLDKKRILKAIERELLAKGFTKSNTPDILIGIFTKSQQQVNVNNMGWGWGLGWGWGWNPWMFGGMNNNININQVTEGTLFIDFIDRESDQLVWQGIGRGALRLQSMKQKTERIQQFVKGILSRYPPKME